MGVRRTVFWGGQSIPWTGQKAISTLSIPKLAFLYLKFHKCQIPSLAHWCRRPCFCRWSIDDGGHPYPDSIDPSLLCHVITLSSQNRSALTSERERFIYANLLKSRIVFNQRTFTLRIFSHYNNHDTNLILYQGSVEGSVGLALTETIMIFSPFTKSLKRCSSRFQASDILRKYSKLTKKSLLWIEIITKFDKFILRVF